MRQLSASEFADIEGRLDRGLAALVYRENEFARMESALLSAARLEPMSAKLKSLRGSLEQVMARLDSHADAAAQKVTSAVDRAEGAIAKVNSLGDEVNATAADIEAMVGTETNGPPQ